jgi:acetyltransferase-like isoleucine patch superfamily enzyme
MIHPTAEVSLRAAIGQGTKIWHHAQVRENVQLGRNCIVGKGAYIDAGVVIGDNVKIQNGANIYHGVTIEDGVFIGPRVCFTNDRFPRAITPEGALKSDADWEVRQTLVRYGASFGAGAIVLPDVTIGRFAMVAAGAVVTKSVPDHGLVAGCPARLIGFVCRCGRRLREQARRGAILLAECPVCAMKFELEGASDTNL